MSRQQGIILYLISLALLLASAAMSPRPIYMDADYYFAGGLNIIHQTNGREPYIWNFLGGTASLPVPAFAYWMPLPAFLAGLSMFFSGMDSYWFARLPFILMAAALPPLSGWLAYSLSKRTSHVWLAGLIAAASGYYLSYQSATSTFTPAMLLGVVFIILGTRLFSVIPSSSRTYAINFCLGIMTGLLHMNRADGLVWFILAVVLSIGALLKKKASLTTLLVSLTLLFSAYLAISGPWYLRNLQEFGALFPPGSNRTLWLTNYDELYMFDASILTPGRWLASGIPNILKARFEAAGNNLVRAVAVQGYIFVTPLILVGLWKFRKSALVRISGIVWLVVFLMMTFIFPYAGMRGGFFHSSAMVQPVFWALIPSGLDSVIQWAAKLRGWTKSRQAWNVFATASILLSLGITAAAVWTKIPKPEEITYTDAADMMEGFSVPDDAVILVNNPPGLFVSTGHPAVVIPSGNAEIVHQAAKYYQAHYLLLDPNNDTYLESLYNDQDGNEKFQFIGATGDLHLYKLVY